MREKMREREEEDRCRDRQKLQLGGTVGQGFMSGTPIVKSSKMFSLDLSPKYLEN